MMIFVDELSTGERLPVRTVTYLWQFLIGHLENEVSPDLFIDLYHQFDLLEYPVEILPDRALVKRQMNRWPTGLGPEVIAIRERNKERIIACLIKKIERRHSLSSRFQFAEGISYEEKEARVREWWNTARFHLSMAIKQAMIRSLFLSRIAIPSGPSPVGQRFICLFTNYVSGGILLVSICRWRSRVLRN